MKVEFSISYKHNNIRAIENNMVVENAKTKFINISRDMKVKCASFQISERKFRLKVGHSESEYQDLLQNLDFEYNPFSFDINMISGTIWYEDGSWATSDYDVEFGYSNWVIHELPEIDADLL